MYPIETVMEAHARMGHVSPPVIRRMVREGMVEGFKVDLNSPTSRPSESPRSKAPWDLVWSDVWGPPDVEAKGGYRYYVSFTDDYSRYTRIYLMRKKSEVCEKYKAFAAWVRTQFKVEIKALRSDRGGEYKAATTPPN